MPFLTISIMLLIIFILMIIPFILYWRLKSETTAHQHTAAQLIEEQKKLQRANLELDSYIYMANHDLKTPLRNIFFHADFLEEDCREKLSENEKKYLFKIKESAKRMDKTIEGLFLFSRLSKIKSVREVVNVNELLDAVLKRIEFDIQRLNVKIIIQENMPIIFCYRIKMSEVFLNLISNAIQFSSTDRKNPEIHIGCDIKKDQIEFYVKDNGIGIDPQYHQRIFEVFEYLNSDGQYHGVGLGLSIAKRIIENHDGKIWVESALGKGATFYFSIPGIVSSS